jgi:glyoxylase-like metal-dependent hydrolase (beta-lactamase superfamily II)
MSGWENVVPLIEAVAPGIEAVVIPSGASRFLSEDGLPVRAYVFGGARECVLVDAGYKSRLSVEAIASAVGARHLQAILCTHLHPDHGGGAMALAARYGAPVRAAAEERASFGADLVLEIDPIEEGEAVEIAGRRLEPLRAPGHTRGHLVFWERASGILFSGDTVSGEGTVVVGPPDGDMRAYMATLDRLARLDPLSLILPGHGPPVCDPQKRIEQYVRHRRMREAQVLEVLRRGPATADDVVAAIYAGRLDPTLLPLARISALGHLEKLVAEGRARREGERYAVGSSLGEP